MIGGRELVGRFKRELDVYRRVLKHPRTPRASKIILGVAVAYAISPIDLIPDFIPVVGHLDDVILLPTLIWAALKLVPEDVVSECRSEGDEQGTGTHRVMSRHEPDSR